MLKRTMFAIMTVLFAVPLFGGAVAYGETGSGETTTTASQTTTGSEADTSTGEVPETPTQKTERETRVKKLKEQQKIKLVATEKKKIQEKCQASQGKMSSVTGRFKGIETSRGELHKHTVERLNALVVKLKAKGVDTTALEADIATLNTKIETFNTDLAAYKQTVTDLKSQDCKTDPEGFKAALVAARAALEKVRTDADGIRDYLKDTIKPLLKTVRDQIDTTKTDGSLQTETNNGGTQ